MREARTRDGQHDDDRRVKRTRRRTYVFFDLERLLDASHTLVTEGLQPECDGHLKPRLVVGDRYAKQFSGEKKHNITASVNSERQQNCPATFQTDDPRLPAQQNIHNQLLFSRPVFCSDELGLIPDGNILQIASASFFLQVGFRSTDARPTKQYQIPKGAINSKQKALSRANATVLQQRKNRGHATVRYTRV